MCIYPFLNHPRKHYDCLIALVVHVVIGIMLTFSFGWQALFPLNSSLTLLRALFDPLHVLCPAQLSGRVFQFTLLLAGHTKKPAIKC